MHSVYLSEMKKREQKKRTQKDASNFQLRYIARLQSSSCTLCYVINKCAASYKTKSQFIFGIKRDRERDSKRLRKNCYYVCAVYAYDSFIKRETSILKAIIHFKLRNANGSSLNFYLREMHSTMNNRVCCSQHKMEYALG